MFLKEKIIVAVISGCVSLLVSLISYYLHHLKFRHEKGLKKTDLTNAFHAKLFELRLSNYHKAFQITEELGKKGSRSDSDIAEIIDRALDGLVT